MSRWDKRSGSRNWRPRHHKSRGGTRKSNQQHEQEEESRHETSGENFARNSTGVLPRHATLILQEAVQRATLKWGKESPALPHLAWEFHVLRYRKQGQVSHLKAKSLTSRPSLSPQGQVSHLKAKSLTSTTLQIFLSMCLISGR